MEAYTHHDKKHSDEGQYLCISLHIVILMLARFHLVFTRRVGRSERWFYQRMSFLWTWVDQNEVWNSSIYCNQLWRPDIHTHGHFYCQDYKIIIMLIIYYHDWIFYASIPPPNNYLGSNWCWSSIAGNPPFVSLNALFWKEWLSILILYFILWYGAPDGWRGRRDVSGALYSKTKITTHP